MATYAWFVVSSVEDGFGGTWRDLFRLLNEFFVGCSICRVFTRVFQVEFHLQSIGTFLFPTGCFCLLRSTVISTSASHPQVGEVCSGIHLLAGLALTLLLYDASGVAFYSQLAFIVVSGAYGLCITALT